MPNRASKGRKIFIMKKNYFYLFEIVLLAMLSIAFVSCGDDDEEVADDVDTTPITMIAGKDKVITGADTISTSNRFVAYGTKNTVHAWHVGEATLLVNGKKSIKITVDPLYYLYDDPICMWGCSMDYVKQNQRQGKINSKSTSNILIYDNAGGATLLAYSFENDKLASVMTFVSTNHTSTLADYLGERYLLLPMYEGDKTRFFGMDALDTDDAKTSVLMDLADTKTWTVFYTNAQKTTRSNISNSKIKEDLKALLVQ